MHSWDILTTPIQICFWTTFNLCEFVSTCKKSGYFIDLFGRYGWLKKSCNWLAENSSAHIRGTKFSQIRILCRSTANNINFHYRSTSVKINDQIFQQIQKILFLSLFRSVLPIFGAKKNFPENLVLPCTTSYGFLAQCQNSEKINDTLPRNCLDRWKDR